MTPHEYARWRVEELRTVPIDIVGQPVRFLDVRDSENFAGHAFAHMISVGMIDVNTAVSKARAGDPLFQHALGLLGVAERPKKLQTSPKRETNYFRDIAITMVIQEILERFDEIKPTASSKAGYGGCACGIVADAMSMTYDAVCSVWKRLGKQI